MLKSVNCCFSYFAHNTTFGKDLLQTFFPGNIMVSMLQIFKISTLIINALQSGSGDRSLIRLHRCANVHWNDASTIETCFHLYWIFLTQTSLEDAAIKIRLTYVCHSCNASELTMSIFAVCRYLIWNEAPRIEPCFHLSWILLLYLLWKIQW